MKAMTLYVLGNSKRSCLRCGASIESYDLRSNDSLLNAENGIPRISSSALVPRRFDWHRVHP
jgi:hypothetical protein